MTKLTKKEAFEYSIKQWKYIAAHGGSKYAAVEALGFPDMRDNCSLCEYAKQQKRKQYVGGGGYCDLCPVSWKNGNCCKGEYAAWIKSKAKKDAQAVVNLLLKHYRIAIEEGAL